MAGPVSPSDFKFRMEGEFSDSLYLVGATVEEGISRLTETTLDFVCTNREVDLAKLLGRPLRVIEDRFGQAMPRVFPGTCISAEFLGTPSGVAHYRAVLRPWLWFLGRKRDNRVFQEQTVLEILKEVLTDHEFWGNVDDNTTGTYSQRLYTIQYRETDLDFICRLMEEEGIYYYFTVQGQAERMVLADDRSAHEYAEWDPFTPFRNLDDASHRMGGHIFSWSAGLGATTGKVTLTDYDFEKPGAKLTESSSIAYVDHKNNDLEAYDYPGRYVVPADGEMRARVRMQAEAARHHTVSGAANKANMCVGRRFVLSSHLRESENRGFMVTRATHMMRATGNDVVPFASAMVAGLRYGEEFIGRATIGDDPYRVLFEAVPEDIQFRAPLVTPWPEIAGVHTAVVTGKKGEEIDTDKYGRIKVQFHWDRKGKKDEKSSCRVRCMMPWTGSGWGMMAVPRIGQEVVVQFEEGNPDRPLVIGMLYNANTMPPWALDANKTQSGVKTRSTKSGNDNTFNELMFEDKKGAELLRFQSERDYEQIVKNDAKITVGEGHKDKGDMALTVHRNLTETVKTGDHAFTVASGNQTLKIKKDKTETVEGKSTLTVTGNVTETVKQGNVSRTLDMGNEKNKLKLGNYSLNADLGKITIEAMQSIELIVGGSSIKIDQMGVTIKGTMNVKVEGGMTVDVKSGLSTTVASDLKTEVKGLMTDVKGTAMLVLKGGITMIN